MRLTEKGQVTIPINVRHYLDLQPGDEVEFAIQDGVVVQRAANAPSRGPRAVDHLLGHKADVPVSTVEIMALTRDD